MPPLDIYFTENVANIIRSVKTADDSALLFTDMELKKILQEGKSQCVAEAIEHIAIYRKGYEAALGAIALAFGILPMENRL